MQQTETTKMSRTLENRTTHNIIVQVSLTFSMLWRIRWGGRKDSFHGVLSVITGLGQLHTEVYSSVQIVYSSDSHTDYAVYTGIYVFYTVMGILDIIYRRIHRDYDNDYASRSSVDTDTVALSRAELSMRWQNMTKFYKSQASTVL